MWSQRISLACASLLLPLLVSCGGGGGGSATGPAPAATGTLKLSLTDAPACGYEQVNVTVQKLRVHQSSSAADADAGWSEINLNPARRVDLLTLSNGVMLELGQMALPVGRYSQLRLVLAANDSASPMANSVIPQGGTEQALTTPSGTQSGIKLNASIDIAANQLADFVLDFDACKSVVRAGASNKFSLKPVIQVTPMLLSGVSGHVAANLATGSTAVSVQQGGVVVKQTMPDAQGKFVLAPVAPGSYTLVITAPGRATGVVNGVTVASAVVTQVGSTATPLTLPASPTGTLAGTVNTGTTPVDAEVRLLQTLSSGPTIELMGRMVDSSSGAYSYTASIAPPLVAAMGASGPSSFAEDLGAAGRFGLQALSGTSSKSAGPLVLAAQLTLVTNFSFP